MIDHCIITKRKFDNTFKLIDDQNFNGYKYYFKPVGEVYIKDDARRMITYNNFDLNILAGICRRAYELCEPTPIIDSDLIDSLNFLPNIPKSFKEKYNYFLSILYKTGGNEYIPRTIIVSEDYPLAFSNDYKEFQRIVDFAIKSNDLECSFQASEEHGTVIYHDLNFTPEGLKKMSKAIINDISIVQQIINSGDIETDRKINHAVSLFYKEDSTIEDKRSACEELSFIIEGFRKDLNKYFTDKDVNLFFQLVNEFDIRHNKENTKKLIYVEQVEWIFLTLLNTVLTYIKIEKRLSIE